MPRVVSNRFYPDDLTCPICQSSFSSKWSLKTHRIDFHEKSGENICSECGERFQLQCRLVKHMIIHTRNEELKCDQCTASFPRIGDLNKHRERQHLIMPQSSKILHRCTECGEKFDWKASLLKHVKWLHGGRQGRLEYIDTRDGSNYKRKKLSSKSDKASADRMAFKHNCSQVDQSEIRTTGRIKTKIENWTTESYDYPMTGNEMYRERQYRERNAHNRTGERIQGGHAVNSDRDENWTTSSGAKLKVVYDVDYQQPD